MDDCFEQPKTGIKWPELPTNLSVSGKHIQCLLVDSAVSETQLVKWEDFFWQLWIKFRGNLVNQAFLIVRM